MLRPATHSARTAHPMEVVYRAHYGFVWHAVRRFGVAGALTDDAVQDTFIAAYRRFDELAMPTVKAWLYGIARRVASNYRRADLRGARKHRALADAAPPADTPPEAVVVLERFLAALDPVDRELFVLSEIEGMTGPEAAAVLALNTSTTYTRVQSLRRRFRASIAGGDPEALVHEARTQRPRATTHGWLALAPQLGLAGAKTVGTAVGLATFAKAAAVAFGVTIAIGTVGTVAGETGPRAPEHPVGTADSDDRHDDAKDSAAAPPIVAALPPSVAAATTLATSPTLAPTTTVVPRPASRTAATRTGPPPPKVALPSLERDHALLRDATRQLRDGDPRAALATTDAHARELPDSALADARAALRIEALCALGETTQARTEARSLLGARPATPVRARVERSCAHKPVVSPQPGQQGDR